VVFGGMRLTRLQAAFLEHGAVQCGFCIPGQLMAADDLLRRHAHPSVAEIEEGLAGNLCRCACYVQIVEAVQAAAGAGPVSAEAHAAVADAPHGDADLPLPPLDQ
jgi:carbon-monoxide dehydrogenase small subunit